MNCAVVIYGTNLKASSWTASDAFLPAAYRSNLSGMIVAPVTFLWNVEKK